MTDRPSGEKDNIEYRAIVVNYIFRTSHFVSRPEEWLTEIKLCFAVLSDKCRYCPFNITQMLHSLYSLLTITVMPHSTLHNQAGAYSVVV